MAAVVFAAAIIYSSSKFRDTLCGAIDINIKDSNQISFISRNDVLQLIHNPSHEILGTPLNDIDINDMEIYLQQQPYIRQADIYKTVNGHLKVDIQQRKPIVEIITATNKNYYIDEDGTIFPGSQKGKAPNVMVANGFISDK